MMSDAQKSPRRMLLSTQIELHVVINMETGKVDRVVIPESDVLQPESLSGYWEERVDEERGETDWHELKKMPDAHDRQVIDQAWWDSEWPAWHFGW